MKNNCFLLFSDIKGFSKLTEDQFETFATKLIPEIYARLREHIDCALAWNTWGDAVFAAYEDPAKIVEFALRYRDIFYTSLTTEIIGVQLKPRIACHFGEATLVHDISLGKNNLFGKNVNTAARLEPSTRPGEIFVTRDFQQACENSPSFKKDIRFDPVGRVICAKAFGELDTFRLRTIHEPQQAIDWLSSLDLAETLPSPPQTHEGVKPLLNSLKKLEPNAIAPILASITSNPQYEGDTFLSVAETYKCAGLYNDAIRTINELENYKIDVDGILIYPYKSRVDAQKIKANALTRIGKYEEAANIIYTLWSSGHKDPDTLSMLAAQYKRRAIYGDNQKPLHELTTDEINHNLIERSCRLYIEAFRLNLDDFYPAINAAYLYKMFGGQYAGAGGTKLAHYITVAWGHRKGESWWLDATLAEAELILDDYALAYNEITQAIARHTPGNFELMATHEQISLYAHFMNKKRELDEMLNYIQSEMTNGT